MEQGGSGLRPGACLTRHKRKRGAGVRARGDVVLTPACSVPLTVVSAAVEVDVHHHGVEAVQLGPAVDAALRHVGLQVQLQSGKAVGPNARGWAGRTLARSKQEGCDEACKGVAGALPRRATLGCLPHGGPPLQRTCSGKLSLLVILPKRPSEKRLRQICSGCKQGLLADAGLPC